MALTPKPKRSPKGAAPSSLNSAKGLQSDAERILAGDPTTGQTPEDDDEANDLARTVRDIARRISIGNAKLSNNSTLETMARLQVDSLLQTPMPTTPGAFAGGAPAKVLKDALDKVETTLVNDIFFTEKRRVDDYLTFEQIYDLVVQASECIQTYCDNIVSPDDFTKRDLTAFYTGPDAEDAKVVNEVRARVANLVRKYAVDDKMEAAIMHSLCKGDYFAAVLNLRQELEGLLTEDGELLEEAAYPTDTFSYHHVPQAGDPDLQALTESLREDVPEVNEGSVRDGVARFLSSFVVFNEDEKSLLARQAAQANIFSRDIDYKRMMRRQVLQGKSPDDKRKVSLAKTQIRGSVIKMTPPENVIKLYQDDTLFGYYLVEVIGQNIADFGRNSAGDQAVVVRSLDQNLAARAFGVSTGSGPENARDRLINRVIVKTLAKRLGKSGFLADHEEFAADAYSILHRARREGKRISITYIASDQMIHFRPDGAAGYGVSVLSRVKFMAKLYIGALTNAFMRNSIRRPEKLVWYIDTGSDADGSNAVQSFIRTVKQSEVKFSNLRDITTTINHIGEFHDFYIPTYNGERPVEVETLNMGPAGEVDNDFLDYLRKSIIAGTGVPAAFLGYSEEVAFARSLTMDNGRFLRRVIRHQKHYGQQATQFIQALYRNEYMSLEDLVGEKPAPSGSDIDDGKPGEPKPVTVKEAPEIGSPMEDAAHKDEDDAEAEDTNAAEDKKRTPKAKKGAKAAPEPGKGDAPNGAGSSSEMPEIDPEFIEIRFPSPSTLNMTNIADAMNQAAPVIDQITALVAGQEDDETQAFYKLLVAKDKLPQIPWERFENLLEEARKLGNRKKLDKLTRPGLPPAAPNRAADEGGNDSGGNAIQPTDGASDFQD